MVINGRNLRLPVYWPVTPLGLRLLVPEKIKLNHHDLCMLGGSRATLGVNQQAVGKFANRGPIDSPGPDCPLKCGHEGGIASNRESAWRGELVK
jgi:hypothetical protein